MTTYFTSILVCHRNPSFNTITRRSPRHRILSSHESTDGLGRMPPSGDGTGSARAHRNQQGYASMHYSSKDETGKKASQGVATPLLAGGRPTGWWSAERLAP
jgi:hypothetical protein